MEYVSIWNVNSNKRDEIMNEKFDENENSSTKSVSFLK